MLLMLKEITQKQQINSHAEGNYNFSKARASHAEGSTTTASGNYSHAEGASTLTME
jgi:trimeric autotransporter adhesin